MNYISLNLTRTIMLDLEMRLGMELAPETEFTLAGVHPGILR